MPSAASLAPVDWLLVGGYLVLALLVGALVKRHADAGKDSYFLADRSLPWWWAGASIAATTFAADTPLAVTGIVAGKGLSGNWIWLSWIGVHAAVAVYFASRWSRSGTLTDAELVSLRYSGAAAGWLRTLRAGLYGVVFNCIILGWVLRAMVKITTPLFHWSEWLPGAMSLLSRLWPAETPLGAADEGMTVLVLLVVVAIYSTLGGIRGVILTDLIQLGIALAGSFWFAASAWQAVGGRHGLVQGLAAHYGDGHHYLDLLPRYDSPWLASVEGGALVFGMYLMVQSYANVPADGGGYLMQRLNTTKSSDHARRASLLFIVLQYVVRPWPWFVVALASLVLIPVGAETQVMSGAASTVAGDRELAYPILMANLLPAGILGLMVTSLLAAFMSTVDTHINWGASYVVNDVYLRLRPGARPAQQVRVARVSVGAFALLAMIVSFQIDTIEQAWQWVAALGAALGIPTALRWLWWRMNAAAELAAMAGGLLVAVVLSSVALSHELRLVVISLASLIGVAAGIAWGRRTDPVVLERFVARVEPLGVWPGVDPRQAARGLASIGARWLGLIIGVMALLLGAHRLVLLGRPLEGCAASLAGASLLWWAGRQQEVQGDE